MTKAKKPDSKSKADLLIEEAVRSIEAEEGGDKEVAPAAEPEELPKSHSGVVGKIDLQQFIDKETYLRLAADFENYRRRAIKERQEAERSGREKALRTFLDILDNLDRGLSQAQGDQGPLASGIRMVMAQAEAWLKAEGLERIPTIGQMFDPAFHEAITQIEVADKPAGQIVEELKRGYRWPDRLLRPASVVTAKNSGETK